MGSDAHFFLIPERRAPEGPRGSQRVLTEGLASAMNSSSGALSALVEKTVEGLGYEYVDCERLARGIVRVTIDTTAEGGISLEDCERVSDQLTHLFTVEDVPYERLEVSSPGVERPLKRARDWERFAGELAAVELFAPMQAEGFPAAGRRKLEGRIIGISGESGAERIEFDYFEVDIARTPRAAALRARKRQTVEAAPVRVVFPLSDVERAHLIRELNFKG